MIIIKKGITYAVNYGMLTVIWLLGFYYTIIEIKVMGVVGLIGSSVMFIVRRKEIYRVMFSDSQKKRDL